MVIHPRTRLAIARLVWRAKRLYRPIGDVMQIGGDFIVDGMGIVYSESHCQHQQLQVYVWLSFAFGTCDAPA